MRFSSDCLTGVPIEMMDQGGLSSIYAQEIRHSSERQVGLWNHEFMGDTYGSEGTSGISNSKTVTSLHHQRLLQAHSLENLERPLSSVKVQKSKLHPNLNGERMPNLPMNSWGLSDQDLRTRKNMCMQHASVFLEEGKIELGKPQYENGLFSSSLSEIFDKKLRLVPSDILLGHSVDRVTPSFEEEEPYQSLKEMEAQMIGNLLPDDEELLSGVVDDIECIAQPSRDDMEDLDLFSSGGGMELELDNNSSSHGVHKVLALDNCMPNCNLEKSSNTVIGEPYPCRTLFVRNINTNIDDSELKLLFQKYGDIRTLYTACKPQGFVMISYYDIRAAADARCSLQNKPLKNQNLDIQYSFLKDNLSEKETNQGILVLFNLDSSVSNKDLCKIFGVYGDVKEIRDSHNGCNSKFIEFYDTRAAEAALHALNNSDIAGKRIMLESIHSVATKQGMIDMAPEFEGGLGLRQQRNLPDNLMSGSFLPGLIPPSFLANKSLSVPLSSIAAPVDPFMEAAFSRISTGVPYSISPSSAVSVVSNHDNQLAYDDLNNSLGQLKVGASCVQSFHPHSLPDYHNPLSSCAPYRTNNNSEHVEGRKGNCPVHGNYAWRNSPSHHPYCMSPMMWSNSPPVANGVHPLPPHQLPRIPRAPSHLPNNILLHNHHVGSAPSMNPSFWDRPHVYNRDSSETHHFHPGSLGTRNPFEISGHNIFPHGGGNCVDLTIPSTNPGLHSPQHICHMFPSRNPSVPVPSSNSTNERSRSRRNEANVNSSDNKKQYELDIDRILRGEDNRTTLMIKNIPNKYTSKMLLVTIDERHRGTYDFIYLPIDFKNKCNVGYAFINMTDPKKIVPFFESFNGKKWEKFNSEKVASLAYARIQGKSALIAHFQNSSLMNEDKRCRPIIFHTEGPNAGDQEPFPTGTDIRCRGSKVQNSGDDENLYKSPPKYINGESSPHGVELSIPTEDHL